MKKWDEKKRHWLRRIKKAATGERKLSSKELLELHDDLDSWFFSPPHRPMKTATQIQEQKMLTAILRGLVRKERQKGATAEEALSKVASRFRKIVQSPEALRNRLKVKRAAAVKPAK